MAALDQTPDEYKRKYDALTKVTAALRKSLDRMEQCSTEFEDIVQTCMNTWRSTALGGCSNCRQARKSLPWLLRH